MSDVNKSKGQKYFVQMSRAHYFESYKTMQKPDYVDEVSITIPHGDADLYDFSIIFKKSGRKVVGLLEMYDDAWGVFQSHPGLFEFLRCHNSNCPTPKALCKELLNLGFIDKTPVTDENQRYVITDLSDHQFTVTDNKGDSCYIAGFAEIEDARLFIEMKNAKDRMR